MPIEKIKTKYTGQANVETNSTYAHGEIRDIHTQLGPQEKQDELSHIKKERRKNGHV